MGTMLGATSAVPDAVPNFPPGSAAKGPETGTFGAMDIRHCARPGCSAPATATMTYDYASRTVWLAGPGDEPDASAWGLCATHAGSLRVPVGWACDDRRTPIIPIRPSIAV